MPLKTKLLTFVSVLTILFVIMVFFGNNQSLANESPEDLVGNPEQKTQYKELEPIDIGGAQHQTVPGGGDLGIAGEDDFYQSEVIEAEFDFNAVGFVWNQPEGNLYQVKIKTSISSDDLGDWVEIGLIKAEGRDGSNQTATDLYFPDETGRYFQYRIELIEGNELELEDLKVAYLDSNPEGDFSTGDYWNQSNSSPHIISRAGWGADENLMTWTPEYASVKKVIVHHTAGPNNPSDPKATIRGIYQYHAVTLGWGDIGYNYLVDQYGNVYQGRKGNNGVIGGHALGYNSGSVGISVLGTFTSVAPTSSARTAVEGVAAWKAAYNGFNPKAKSSWKGTNNYNLAGHRDYNSTGCPGNAFYSYLPSMRSRAYNNLKNYEPGEVNDLKVVMRQQESVELEWTAPGAFWGFGKVDRYQVFHSTSPITNQYSFLGVISDPVTPENPGTVQRVTISGLSPGVKYYFSIRAKNWENKWSTVSKNTVTFTKPRTDYLASEIPAYPYLTAPGGDVYLWKTYNFDTTLDGTVRIELTGQAESNGSSDDDDLKIVLDGTDYEWGSEYALDGDTNNKVKIIVIETDLVAGSHTLELWADETPSLRSLYVEGVNCQNKNFAVYPQKRAPGGNLYLWKTYNFEVGATGDYYIEVAAAAETNGSSDDDDLRIVIDGNDYGWGGENGFDGDTEKGRERSVLITRNLNAGDHTLEIYADGSPILNAVEIYPTSDLQKIADLPSSQLGLSTDLNTARWRVQQFSCDEGPVKIKVKGYAQKNGSSDDDDLKIVLDGIDYHWSSNKSLNGDFDNAQTRTLVLNQSLTAGVHTLEIYTDETPNLLSVEVFGTPSTQNYLVEAYPEETASSLDVEVWKDSDYNFSLSESGVVRFEVMGSVDKNSSDDDDLKLVLVKTDSPQGNIDYNWNTTDALNGNSLKGAAKKIVVEQFLRSGSYKLQVWGDVSPTLNSVIVQGVSSGGNLASYSLNEPTGKVDRALVKDYYFSAEGSTTVVLDGFASRNQSDDDDLRIVLDGQNYDWNTDDSLDGNRDNGRYYSLTIGQNLSAGLHHLQIYADETPEISSIVITGTGSSPTYRESDSFPDVTAPGGDRYLWSAETQNFTFAEAGVLIVTAACDSNGSSDDDDLKIVVDGQDYGWLFNGDSLKGDTTSVEIPLSAGAHTVQFYADVTPTLYAVFAAERYTD